MSVYNGTIYLRESVESILNQTLKDFEFIIINDGSTDNTWEIISEYAKQDQRIKLFKNEQNIGLTKSLNKGLRLAQGEYIARQDADDVSLPNRFKLQTHFLDQHSEVGAVGSVAEIIDEHGLSLGKSNVPLEHESLQVCLLVNNCLYHSSMMLRQSLLQTLGGYKEELCYAQDYDLWWRISRLARLVNLPDQLILVRRSHKNISNVYRQAQLQCALDISLNAVQETLKEPLDKDAYQRFWWTEIRAADEDANQHLWFADHKTYTPLRWIDIQSLEPFWKLLANYPSGTKIWGPRLRRLGYKLLSRGQTVEGLQLLWLAANQFKLPFELDRVVKSVIKPYVPASGYQLWKTLNLKLARN